MLIRLSRASAEPRGVVQHDLGPFTQVRGLQGLEYVESEYVLRDIVCHIGVIFHGAGPVVLLKGRKLGLFAGGAYSVSALVHVHPEVVRQRRDRGHALSFPVIG